MKIFSFVIAVVMSFSVFCSECVKIEPIYTEGEHYFAREQDKHEDKLLQFQIKVMPNSIRKENGSLVFEIKLTNVKVVGESNSIDMKDVVIENGISNNLTINQQADNAWESDAIKIVVAEDQLANSPFSFKTSNAFRLLINNSEKKIDPLRFYVTPTLSIYIPDDKSKVRFGKIIYDKGLVKSSKKHEFNLIYYCITQARLIISSDTDYNLKDKNGNTMPFRLLLSINGDKKKVSSTNHEFDIPSDKNLFENNIAGKCYIKFPAQQCPIAGEYRAKVTFTIEAG